MHKERVVLALGVDMGNAPLVPEDIHRPIELGKHRLAVIRRQRAQHEGPVGRHGCGGCGDHAGAKHGQLH